MKTLIRNAQIVSSSGVRTGNVLIEDSKIVDIDAPATAAAEETVDATGQFLLPGIIDDQVHFRDPGLTHKEDLHTGSVACARGGITTFLEMPNTKPATITNAALEDKLALAAGRSVVNYGFYIGATCENVAELKIAKRTPGIKIFIGSSTGNLLVDEQAALEKIFAETTLPICAHCEDESTVRANRERIGDADDIHNHSKIRDHRAAEIATARAIDLAQRHKHRFHVLHVSTANEIPLIQNAGEYVTAEVCPHHLFFNTNDYDRLGSLVQMNPSIKTPEDNSALWDALRDGTIEVVATDHAPHTLDEKKQPYPQSPSGLPAVENSLALMLNAMNDGQCTIEQIVSWMCEAPARVWDICNKGHIKDGFDADLVLVDPNREHTIRNAEQLTKSGWSPWHGTTVVGQPVRTWVMGETVYRDGQVDDSVRGTEVQFDHG